ncbi:MAG TPA: hypothetical protein VMH35_27575 [Streptosporangiaceae bacterium]|nr:hypothetical protein [Streptosporangiaceae bacterium]
MTNSPPYVVDREPRRPRYLIPRDTPRRGAVVAALTLLGIIAHLLLAQLTLLLAAGLDLAGRATRWRPGWLAVPAVAGLIWLLATGPRAALAGFTEGPRQVLGYLAGAAAGPGRVRHLGRAYAGLARWLPRQAPLALLAAAAEAAVASWLRGRHAADAALPPARPGPVALARRQYAIWSVRHGGVAGRAGAVLGVDWPAGRPAEVPWPAAERGVLVAGAAAGEVAAAGFQFAHAAIRRRKPVFVVDLAGTPGLAAALGAVCAGSGAPLHVLGPAGPGCYEPWRGGLPARQAALLLGMIDWAAAPGPVRRTATACLTDLLAVAAAAPAGPRAPVLDEVASLLSPDALRARMRQVPPYHPHRTQLAERARVSASLLDADPAAGAFLAAELAGLRTSPLGRWLRPALPGEDQVSLTAVLRDRAVVLFSLGPPQPARAARLLARLAALDLTAASAESARDGIGADGLAWFTRAGELAGPVLAGLLRTGPQAGLATVLGSTAAGPAEQLAPLASVLVVQEPELAGRLGLPRPARPGQFVLAVREPGRQPRPACRSGRFVAGGVR